MVVTLCCLLIESYAVLCLQATAFKCKDNRKVQGSQKEAVVVGGEQCLLMMGRMRVTMFVMKQAVCIQLVILFLYLQSISNHKQAAECRGKTRRYVMDRILDLIREDT